jgi:hypothetical protein
MLGLKLLWDSIPSLLYSCSAWHDLACSRSAYTLLNHSSDRLVIAPVEPLRDLVSNPERNYERRFHLIVIRYFSVKSTLGLNPVWLVILVSKVAIFLIVGCCVSHRYIFVSENEHSHCQKVESANDILLYSNTILLTHYQK